MSNGTRAVASQTLPMLTGIGSITFFCYGH